MELDGNSNYAVRQTIYLTPGNYILNFRWARRSGATATSGMSITWDGKKIFSVPGDPKDDSIH